MSKVGEVVVVMDVSHSVLARIPISKFSYVHKISNDEIKINHLAKGKLYFVQDELF